jgi:hypothetical protein
MWFRPISEGGRRVGASDAQPDAFKRQIDLARINRRFDVFHWRAMKTPFSPPSGGSPITQTLGSSIY